MIRAFIRFAVVSVWGGLMFVTTAAAQDFQKTYRIADNGPISITNVSGNIAITGYEGEAVAVYAFKEGRDRDLVEIEDLSGNNSLELRVRYPSQCNCDASVRFDVRVPRSANYNVDRISTASGNIEANGIKGHVRLHTASGNVLVKDVTGSVTAATASGQMRVRDVIGEVSAQSASGDVDVEIARLEGTEGMKFSSASGDVRVKLPANLDANVELSTATGSIKTDFPIEVHTNRYGPGTWARGQLGTGSRSLRISSASGNVSLTSF